MTTYVYTVTHRGCGENVELGDGPMALRSTWQTARCDKCGPVKEDEIVMTPVVRDPVKQ